jgi:uncharacterized protein YciI
MHYLLIYEFVPDYLERRTPFRAEHLRLAWESHDRGEMILGGAFADPADGGAMLFKCDSPDVPRRFAESDPYVRNGVVLRYTVRTWTTVIGADASTPVRPT